MSVGMTGFAAQTNDLDIVDVARRATRLIWDQRMRIWPYVLALAVVDAVVRTVAWRYGLAMGEGYQFRGGETLGDFGRHGAWLFARAIADGLVLGMLVRAMLGYAGPAWRPDRGLLGFTAIYVAAAAAPLALFLPTVLAWDRGGVDSLPLVIATGVGGACALAALAYFCLRLVIWPVGVAVGDREMHAGRAWQAMVGARLAWVFAGVLLMLPLVFGAAVAGGVVFSLYGVHGGPVGGPWGAPMHALATGLWVSVAAAVYRLRAGLEA